MPTKEDLKELQIQTLSRKILISHTRILEWCIKNDWNVFVSFSAGKDSCVLAELVAQVWKENTEKPLTLVYSDTGMEFIEVKKHSLTFKNYLSSKYQIKVDLITLRPKANAYKVFKDVGYPIISKKIARQLRDLSNPTNTNYNSRKLYTTGLKINGDIAKSFRLAQKWRKLFKVGDDFKANIPFKVSEECCKYLKKKPLQDFEKKSGMKTFVGTMASDSSTREQGWLLTGCNNFSRGGQSKPISFWLEHDILSYIKQFNIPISSVYGEIVEINGKLKTTGEHNTGCKYCMFGCHLEKGETRFERLKKLEPISYEYAMREENGLGLAKVLDFLGVKY
ncbi:MAG: phosphoadenosine phosphosulfate reductase family protein [bacterium]